MTNPSSFPRAPSGNVLVLLYDVKEQWLSLVPRTSLQFCETKKRPETLDSRQERAGMTKRGDSRDEVEVLTKAAEVEGISHQELAGNDDGISPRPRGNAGNRACVHRSRMTAGQVYKFW